MPVAVLAGASRLVADFMYDASLIYGAFYRHFADNNALKTAALAAAFAGPQSAPGARLAAETPSAAVASYRLDYLQEYRLETPAMGRPGPTLAGDVARHSPTLRAIYGANLGRIVETLACGVTGSAKAMLAGAIMLARERSRDRASGIVGLSGWP